MTGPSRKGAHEGVSRGMKVVIAVMLLVVLLPTAMMSLPLAKIVVIVSNVNDNLSVSGSVSMHGDYVGQFAIPPGNKREFSYFVSSGEHELRVYYHFEEINSISTSISRTCTVWPLGTEEITIQLMRTHYYADSLMDTLASGQTSRILQMSLG